MQGFLSKRGDWGKWSNRYFAISGDSLLYFSDSSDKAPRGNFPLSGATIGISGRSKNAFAVTPKGGKEICVAAGGPRERNEWIRALRAAAAPDDAFTLTNVKFGEGPLGLRLLPDKSGVGSVKLEAVGNDSAAAATEVSPEWVIFAIDGKVVRRCTYAETVGLIKASGRPLSIDFVPPGPPEVENDGSSNSSAASTNDISLTVDGDDILSDTLPDGEVFDQAGYDEWLSEMNKFTPEVQVMDPSRRGSIHVGTVSLGDHVAYRIVTTVSNSSGGGGDGGDTDESIRSVQRRYSDFVWLQQALSNRYKGMCVPPAPQKQTNMMDSLMGRKGGDVEKLKSRMRLLGIFIDRVLKNPFLKKDVSVVDFLSVQDDTDFKKCMAKDSEEKARKSPGYIWWVRYIQKSDMPDLVSRKLADLRSQVIALQNGLSALQKASSRVHSRLNAISSAASEAVDATNKFQSVQSDVTDPSKNEYPMPCADLMKGTIVHLQTLMEQLAEEARKEPLRFGVVFHHQVKYMSLELTGMLDILKKRSSLDGKLQAKQKKLSLLLSKTADEACLPKHQVALKKAKEEKRVVEQKMRFIEKAIFTFSLGEFRKGFKHSFMRMMAQYASGQIHRCENALAERDVLLRLTVANPDTNSWNDQNCDTVAARAGTIMEECRDKNASDESENFRAAFMEKLKNASGKIDPVV